MCAEQQLKRDPSNVLRKPAKSTTRSIARRQRSRNFRDRATQLLATTRGSRPSGPNAPPFAEKESKTELLCVESWTETQFKRRMRANARQARSLMVRGNAMDLRNVQPSGLLVHGRSARRNAEVESKVEKLFAWATMAQRKLPNVRRIKFCSPAKTAAWSLALTMNFCQSTQRASLWRMTTKARIGAMKIMMRTQQPTRLLKRLTTMWLKS